MSNVNYFQKTKNYIFSFMIQLIIIGMAINIRTDIPFWKQLSGYMLIACIFPLSMIFHDMSNKE